MKLPNIIFNIFQPCQNRDKFLEGFRFIFEISQYTARLRTKFWLSIGYSKAPSRGCELF